MNVIQQVKEIVNSINYSIEVETIETINGFDYITFCNPLYVNTLETVFNEKILSISENGQIKIKTGQNISIGQIATLQPIKFLHGQINDARQEIELKNDEQIENYPLAYLLENPFSFTNQNGKITASIRLFLLNRTSFEDLETNNLWLTNDHYREVILPMERVAKAIEKSIKKNSKLKNLEKYEITYLKDFGVYQDKQGTKKTILDKNLSGVEMAFELTFFNYNCC